MTDRLALLIGNSDYTDPGLARLVTPSLDVRDLADLLRLPEIGGFQEVTALVNSPASDIRKAVARFFNTKQRDDLLLLYFSGHGVLDDRGRLYLAAHDTEHDLLSATALEAGFITDAMDRSFSRRQILILDCCHSGAFAAGAKGAPGMSVGTATAFEGKGYGRVVLTATDATQYAWEGDRVIGEAQNSVFTHYLIEGLRSGKADLDGDGRITLDEMYDFVYERVVKETPRMTPAKWSYKQQGEIILARNPHPEVKPAELPKELQQAIESPFSGVREGAVSDLTRLLKSSDRGMVAAAVLALEVLTQDDSRRVSTLANEALAAHEAKTAPPAAPSQEQLAPAPAQVKSAPPVKAATEVQVAAPAETKASVPAVETPLTYPGVKVEAKPAAAEAARGAALPLWGQAAVIAGGWFAGWLLGLALAYRTGYIGTDVLGPWRYIAWWMLPLGAALAGLVAGWICAYDQPRLRWKTGLLLGGSWLVLSSLSTFTDNTGVWITAEILSGAAAFLVLLRLRAAAVPSTARLESASPQASAVKKPEARALPAEKTAAPLWVQAAAVGAGWVIGWELGLTLAYQTDKFAMIPLGMFFGGLIAGWITLFRQPSLAWKISLLLGGTWLILNSITILSFTPYVIILTITLSGASAFLLLQEAGKREK